MRRSLSAALALTILLGSPGLPAYQASAALVARPAMSVNAPGWSGAVGSLLHAGAAGAVPGLTPRLESVLGQVRFALDAQAAGVPALAFVQHLPAAYAADPAAFAALPPARQAELLAPAIDAAAAPLQARADALLVRFSQLRQDDAPLTAEDRAELRALEPSWFYLKPADGRAIRSLTRTVREMRSIHLAERIARSLGRPVPDAGKLASDAAASSELDFVLAGAARLAKADPSRLARPGPGAANSGLTRDVLSPYLTRALDRAAALQAERDMDPASVSALILGAHMRVFGGKAAKPALRALRPAGEWSEFVAAASLHAAAALAGAEHTTVLRTAAADSDLSLAIPSWHPAAAEGAATVGELLASRHGVEEYEFPMKGRLFTAFGVPVRAEKSLLVVLPLMTWSVATQIVSGSPYAWAIGAASVALLYLTLLGHEFGHALAARRFGIKTHGIALNFMGGAAYLERESLRPMHSFLISFAGPAVNLLYAAVTLPLLLVLDPSPMYAVLLLSGAANLAMGVMNLLPIYPMDGGHILRSGLHALLKDHYKATHVAAWIGMGLSFLAGAWAWHRVVTLGDWSSLFTVLMATFLLRGARAALYHPGTALVEPVTKK